MPNLKVPSALADSTPTVVNQPPQNQDTQPKEEAPVTPKPKKTRGIRKDVVPKQRAKKYNSRKIEKKVDKCEHVHEKYYSRGLCKNCYHKLGRIKLAIDCPHTDRKLYARNVCKGCYLRIFFRQNKLSDKAEEGGSEDKS